VPTKAITVLLIAACLAGCGATTDDAAIDVLAAASLSDTFNEIIEQFTEVHPDITVSLSTAGSATLATQVQQGAPVDVVAFADTIYMDELVDAGFVDVAAVQTLATNTVAILVASGNPLGIDSIDDLASDDIVVVMCDEAQPCGASAAKVLARAGVSLVPASLESNVNGVVQKVLLGEADAGFAYVTDATAHIGRLDHVEIPTELNVSNEYPIASLNQSNTDVAATNTFMDFVLTEGRAILRNAGFGPPPS
jgi:molybdate transport system substrate-binding protein